MSQPETAAFIATLESAEAGQRRMREILAIKAIGDVRGLTAEEYAAAKAAALRNVAANF